ncbi:trypsin-like peptidase domain-containing protein [Thauera sp. CAU 1555]|uniref:Trypsin-like peptidase domain-containing protein n=1 Tax=Thauera sedimentorum TaxID=2767595 RepID=A0ABR9B6E5_9RHOO|nr:serine protease [Thauera sedimentorum]MBC9071027.1 trypsin-like peptidase domain-containing protein [Thauera sedimentorum]MBD8501946.1 trypsin-like peptidase domain-containing protein [Thauera sedimentorum]
MTVPFSLRRRAVLHGSLALGTVLAAPSLCAELVEAVPRIRPSVVAVGTYMPNRNPAFRFLGTGFAVGDGRLIATNAHVVPEVLDSERMEVVAIAMASGQTGVVRRAERVASDKEHDLAVLRIEGAALPALELAPNDGVREGQSIAFTGFPIGNALGLSPVTHRGIVSAITPIGIPQANARDLNPALIRRLSGERFEIYQLDATAYPGNSGSPVFDPGSGQIIGVINMVFVKRTKESVLSDPSGISYAIPVTYLRAMLQGLR